MTELDVNQRNAIEFNRSVSKKLLAICHPLNLIGANHFSYQRIYPNKTAIRLDTEPDYNSFMIQNKSFDKYSFMVNLLRLNKMLLINNLGSYPTRAQRLLKEGFLMSDIKQFYAIYSYNHINHYIEGCAVFRIKSHNSDFYRLDLLNKFQQYFLLAASDILEQIQQDNILFNTSTDINKCEEQSTAENDFLKLITPNKIPLKIRNKVVYLTKKEAICIKYLTQGYSAKEIAILLDNSPRTIENHIYHIKEKSTNAGLNIIKESFRRNNLSLLFE